MCLVSKFPGTRDSQSVMSDSATPWTTASQASLPMGFSRQENWSGSHPLLQSQELGHCLLDNADVENVVSMHDFVFLSRQP